MTDTFFATEEGHCGKPREWPGKDGGFIDEVETLEYGEDDCPETWDEKQLAQLQEPQKC